MKKPRTSKPTRTRPLRTSVTATGVRRAALFRNGANQAVRLPQELRFSQEVKEVRIRRQGDGLLISPIRPDWTSFFCLQVEVPEDFLEQRDLSPSQSREPL